MSSTSFLGASNANILFMTYDTSYVGIGCFDPATKLDVAGHATMRSNVVTKGVATFSNDVTLANNGFVTMSTSNNNLGISKSTPVEKLDVAGKIQTSSQFLASSNQDADAPAFTFTGNSNTGMFRPSNNNLAFSTAGTERIRVDNNGYIGIGLSNPTKLLDVNGDTLMRGKVTANDDVTMYSNVTIMGRLNVSNVTYITSNVYIYSSETVQSNLIVNGDGSVGNNFSVQGATLCSSNLEVIGVGSFSNSLILGSNNGKVEFTTSNNMLGVNIARAPRADLDISGGNILAKNFQRLSKSAENSNPLNITINWENAHNANNLYHLVADVYQSITNGNEAGFRTQRLGIGVSNSIVSWYQNPQVFGSSNAYLTLEVVSSATTSKSITLQSSTTWQTTGDCCHGFNIDIVHFPYTSNVGMVYLT
jgi:predicted acyltransferase (DUF342 family)